MVSALRSPYSQSDKICLPIWKTIENPDIELAQKHESTWKCHIIRITKDEQTSKVIILLEHTGPLKAPVKLHLDPLLLEKSPENRFIVVQVLKEQAESPTHEGYPTSKVELNIDLTDEKYKALGLSLDNLLFLDSSTYDSMILQKLRGQTPEKPEQSHITTLAIGEEGQDGGADPANRLTTKMVGEESQDGGREFPDRRNRITTMMVGEEGQDSGIALPYPEAGITTMMVGEESQDSGRPSSWPNDRMCTQAIGEGQQAWHTHQNLTTKMVGEEGQH